MCEQMLCQICKIDVVNIKEITYMLRDTLWEHIVIKNKLTLNSCFLCIACIENTINRKLDCYDFDLLSVNLSNLNKNRSEKLNNRLEGFDNISKIAAIRATNEIIETSEYLNNMKSDMYMYYYHNLLKH